MEALDQIARRLGKRRELRRNEALFRLGDRSRGVFLVESGRIELLRHTRSGRVVTLHAASAGSLFAEASLYSPRYHCDAIAAAKAVVIELPKHALLDAFAREPELAAALSAHLAAEVMKLRTRLALTQVRNARERVLAYLALEAGAGATVRFGRPLKSVAAEIGLSHEAFYRALSALQEDGRIRRTPGEVSLIEAAGARRPSRAARERKLEFFRKHVG